MTDLPKVLLVGYPETSHVGGHLIHAARQMGVPMAVCDMSQAYHGPAVARKLAWRLLGRLPLRLHSFSASVVKACQKERPDVVLTTGVAPVRAQTLEYLREMGIARANFLTDDPWNPAHRAPWFLRALPSYGHVFTPRHAAMAELVQIGCPEVSYLPFGFDPSQHFPAAGTSCGARNTWNADVVFVGGADKDREPFLAALVRAGINAAAYGGYWQQYPATRPAARGFANEEATRLVTGGAKIALCLVRRANRDGHVMRSFEIPAMKGCLLAEDTADHRTFFGEDGESALYFRDVPEMVAKARWLLERDEQREHLAARAHNLIVHGENTYKDRLCTMLKATRCLPCE